MYNSHSHRHRNDVDSTPMSIICRFSCCFRLESGPEIDMLATFDVESTSFRCHRIFLSHWEYHCSLGRRSRQNITYTLNKKCCSSCTPWSPWGATHSIFREWLKTTIINTLLNLWFCLYYSFKKVKSERCVWSIRPKCAIASTLLCLNISGGKISLDVASASTTYLFMNWR